MERFDADRSLLNPKFEGYRLDPIVQESRVFRHNLPSRATQVTVSSRSLLSFEEVQSRITHNHITVADGGDTALYVDSGHRVILIHIDSDTLQPSFHPVYELPQQVQSSSVTAFQHEYPSAAFLTNRIVFVSDGYGCMYILDIMDDAAQLLSTYELPFSLTETSVPVPFRIHFAVSTDPANAVILISSRRYDAQPATIGVSTYIPYKSHVEFDVWAIGFTLPMASSLDSQLQNNVLWHRRGDGVPLYSLYDDRRSSYMLIGPSVYRPSGVLPPPVYEPSPDEIVPFPQLNQNLDRILSSPGKPPPYSWTQTPDSVTVAFPLPSTTSKTDINVILSTHTLTLHIRNEQTNAVPLPHYAARVLWDNINTSASFWTWDREAEHTYGLLTLHLDKSHEGHKWVQVFAASLDPTTKDDDVPETLDPSELYLIREALEKYTSALQDGKDTSGLGLGQGVPSLAEGEMDDEVDSSVGKSAYITWIKCDGGVPEWYNDSYQVSFTLLSTPLPGIHDTRGGLIVKNQLDGTVFSLTPGADPTSPAKWNHMSTFPALAFVLASKRDTRFTYHIPSKAIFAFENGSSSRGGNVYIYRASPITEKWAKQAILQVLDGSSGSLLGVGAVTHRDRQVLLCLTEGELIILKDVV